MQGGWIRLALKNGYHSRLPFSSSVPLYLYRENGRGAILSNDRERILQCHFPADG